MAKNQRNYDHEFKTQAVKLAKEIGSAIAGLQKISVTLPISPVFHQLFQMFF